MTESPQLPCPERGPCVQQVGGIALHVCREHKTLCSFTASITGRPEVVVCQTCPKRPSPGVRHMPSAVGLEIRPIAPPPPPSRPPIPAAPAVEGAQPIRPTDTLLFNRHDQQISLTGLYAGHSCFLIGGGPSLNEVDVEALSRHRGVLTAAMNNVGSTHVRPHVWFCVDDPKNFQEAIWLDPAILKFTFRKYRLKPIYGFDATGTLVRRDRLVKNCPAVVFIEHSHGWQRDEFLRQARPTWGPNEFDSYDGKRGRNQSVMLVALRMLYSLGVRDVFLLGCDFHVESAENAYAFGQGHADGQTGKATANNSLYAWLDKQFALLQPQFLQAGYRVWNCTAGSHLTAFPRMSLDDAIRIAVKDQPPAIRVRGHYVS